MLAAAVYSCDANAPLRDLCRTLAPHDPGGVGGFVLQHLVPPVVIFAVIYVAGRLLRRGAARAVARAGGDPQLDALVHNVGAAVIYFFAVISALVAAGIPLALMLTFGGLTSLAIGLAFQDLLRNILAGIWLLLERPFRIGDLITVGDTGGVVQTITLRTTALRTADGRLAVMPNLTVFTGVVLNSSAFERRRYTVTLRLERDRDLEAAMRSARHELEATTEIVRQPPPAVRPQLDGEGILLNCDYWLDYRARDTDAVTAEIVRRLWVVLDGDQPAATAAD